MRYATLEDVQARIPSQIWTPEGSAQPLAATVQDWIAETERWIDTTLTWRYQTPITNDADLALLRPLVADLVAARVWAVKMGHNPQQGNVGSELKRTAHQMLAYNAATGRSVIALSTAQYSEAREAALSVPVASFSDPDGCGHERWFSAGMEF